MWIIVSRGHKPHFVGRVVDLCLVCRAARTMRLLEVRDFFALFGVTVGRGHIHARLLVCDGCGQRREVAEGEHGIPSKTRTTDPAELPPGSRPTRRGQLASQDDFDLALEERSGRLPPPRRRLLHDRTLALWSDALARQADRPWRARLGRTILQLGFVSGVVAAGTLLPGQRWAWLGGPLLGLVAGRLGFLALATRLDRRHMDRRINPRYVPALRATGFSWTALASLPSRREPELAALANALADPWLMQRVLDRWEHPPSPDSSSHRLELLIPPSAA